ncbi:cell division protein YceG [Mergibacter septicus]|uniref:endolytic transglycosylase MltG n=1 Tax=Mergibacter septicus TaxID=221402 RepID=UPI001179769D|nr:endolytic transglycosylase MltG [Mergibacter septicus]AWX14223.1 cell division protein YceG [Mergibacter septicus]
MKKILGIVFLSIILIITCLTGGFFWLEQQFKRLLAEPITATPQQLIEIKRGTTPKAFTQQLISEKIVANPTLLPWLLKRYPQYSLKAGTYSLENLQSLQQLLERIHSGKEVQLTFQMVEGTTTKQWLNKLKNSPYLRQTLTDKSESEIYNLLNLPKTADPQQQKIEGWLYPDTYHYSPNSTDLTLLQRASQHMQTRLAEIWQEREADLPLKTPYQLLILASIVEKETGINAERSTIASVFINRLKRGMKLQTDPTVIYGMGENYQGNLRKKDLTTPTEYNTYVIEGLPPTPIAMPSEASLLAVAHPANTDYLYFVANGSGGHTFSKTLREHNQAVQRYLRWYRSQK